MIEGVAWSKSSVDSDIIVGCAKCGLSHYISTSRGVIVCCCGNKIIYEWRLSNEQSATKKNGKET